MELKIAQLLQNSRKDDLPPFSGRGNILRYSVQLGDFFYGNGRQITFRFTYAASKSKSYAIF